MPFLKYRDNDSGLRPTSYPYILGRELNEYRINNSVTIYLIVYEALVFNRLTGLGVASAVNLSNHLSFIDYIMTNTSCPLINPIHQDLSVAGEI